MGWQPPAEDVGCPTFLTLRDVLDATKSPTAGSKGSEWEQFPQKSPIKDIGTNPAEVFLKVHVHPPNQIKEAQMTRTTTTSLGDLITLFYEEFLALYGDEDIASVAAASVINELIAESRALCLEDAA